VQDAIKADADARVADAHAAVATANENAAHAYERASTLDNDNLKLKSQLAKLERAAIDAETARLKLESQLEDTKVRGTDDSDAK
jgi:hypothetical protein